MSKQKVTLQAEKRGDRVLVFGRVHDAQIQKRYNLPSEKVRRKFKTEALATKWIAEIETYAAGMGLRSRLKETTLSDEDLRDAEAARQILPEGITLTEAVSLAKHRGLFTASESSSDPLAPAIEKFLEYEKDVRELEKPSIADKKTRLGIFMQEARASKIGDFNTDNIKKMFLRKKRKPGGGRTKEKTSLQTRKNDRAVLHDFGEWLVAEKLLAANPVSGFERFETGWSPPGIFTPEQADELMGAVLNDELSGGRFVGYFAIGLFAGLRPEAEIPYLDFKKDIKLDEDVINIYRQKVRGASQRIVPISKNLHRWLVLCKKKKWGLQVPPRRAYDRIRKAAAVRQVWSADVMRHSYATYSLANGVNETELASRMGNSVRVIRRDYLNLSKPRKTDAEKFWKIRPN